jgi:hypothetical protein
MLNAHPVARLRCRFVRRKIEPSPWFRRDDEQAAPTIPTGGRPDAGNREGCAEPMLGPEIFPAIPLRRSGEARTYPSRQ